MRRSAIGIRWPTWGPAWSTAAASPWWSRPACKTEIGRIATLIESVGREPTPLQRRLAQLGRVLALVALAIVGVVFTLGILRGEDLQLMLLTAISMAVAAVPEGLPAVVTIALALGAQRMLERRALMRKLSAVETLGSVTVICTDKTGTLTENRMTVRVLDVAGRTIDMQAGPPGLATGTTGLLLAGCALCNDASLDSEAPAGDPTEIALLDAALRAGWSRDTLLRGLPRVAEAPFDAARKRMTTIHRVLGPRRPSRAAPRTVRRLRQGAVDSVLSISYAVWPAIGRTCWTRRGPSASAGPTTTWRGAGCACSPSDSARSRMLPPPAARSRSRAR